MENKCQGVSEIQIGMHMDNLTNGWAEKGGGGRSEENTQKLIKTN